MKVLFFITVAGHGRGGHFHSLNHISRSIAQMAEVSIISIGPGRSPVLDCNPYFIKHLEFNVNNILKFRKNLKIVLQNDPEAYLHFFDLTAYCIIKPLLKSKKYRLILNKCGGPNPSEFPKVENLVLFSKENYNWFKSKGKFRSTNIVVIPNRAGVLQVQEDKTYLKPQNQFTFVRIARIGLSYRKSILNTIELIKILRSKYDLDVGLFIIGAIQDEEVHNEIVRETIDLDHIVLLTEDRYTSEASKYLYLADAVIATGRGIMESASLGIPILTPAKNSTIPILVTQDNFNRFFDTNFSERNEASNFDLENNLEGIRKMVIDPTFWDTLSGLSRMLFEEYFSISKAAKKYVAFYKQAKSSYKSIVPDFKLYLKCFYFIYIQSRK